MDCKILLVSDQLYKAENHNSVLEEHRPKRMIWLRTADLESSFLKAVRQQDSCEDRLLVCCHEVIWMFIFLFFTVKVRRGDRSIASRSSNKSLRYKLKTHPAPSLKTLVFTRVKDSPLTLSLTVIGRQRLCTGKQCPGGRMC